MKHLHLLATVALLLFVVLILANTAIAQPPPPALPGMPDQAPLGGLGLLAAAGGAYAWKKLRDKH